MWHPFLNHLALWYIRCSPYKKGEMYVRLLERSLREQPASGVLKANYGAMFHFRTTDVLQRYLYTFGTWEPAITAFVDRRLKQCDTFIDVGANIGYFTLLASSKVGTNGSVLAVEVSPSIFTELEANVQLNSVENVRLVNMAVTGKPGEVDVFQGPTGNLGLTTIVKARGFSQEASVRGDTLAAIATPAEIKSARIMKIDVEGNEPEVIEGLASILGTTRPDLEIILEVSPEDDLVRRGTSQAAMLDPFERAGFRAYVVDNRYEPWVYARKAHSMQARRMRAPLQQGGDLILTRNDTDILTI